MVRISLRRNGPITLEDTDSQVDEEASGLLREYGEQEVLVTVKLPPTSDIQKPVTLFSKKVSINPRRIKPAGGGGSGAELLLVDGAVQIPIRLKLDDSVKLKAYDVIIVEVRHVRPDDYLPEDGTARTSFMEARLRLMPEWFAARVFRGIGPRAFVTAQVPTGLFRIPNSGFAATSSSSYATVESAIFGIGALGVIEAYDFDRAAPALPFNPQLHFGLLASSTLKEGAPPPRLSAILGAGFRLLGGEQKADATASGLSAVFWIEWAQRARNLQLQPALLVGLSVNIGSFPN